MDAGIGPLARRPMLVGPPRARWQVATVATTPSPQTCHTGREELICFNSALAVSQWLQALVLWSNRRRLQPNVISYTSVLRALRRRWVQSLHWLQGMMLEGVRANGITVNTALNALQRRGHWRRALGLVVPELVDAITYNSAISACEHLHRDLLGFSACLSAAKPWTLTLELLRWMTQDLVQPNLVSLSATVGTVPWPGALYLLKGCQEGRLEADRILFGASISTCSSGLAWRQGLALAATRPSLIGCNAAMDGCQGAWPVALQIFGELQIQGYEPSAASVHVAGYRWQGAFLALVEMARRQLKRDLISFGVALNACQMQSLWLSALQLMEDLQMVRLAADQICFNSCTSSCGEADQWQMAMQLKGAAVATASYNAAISACDGPGEWRAALASLGAMPQSRLARDQRTYNAASSAARLAWRKSLALMEFCTEDLAGYSAVISAYETKSLWKPALGVLELLQLRSVELDTIVYNGASSTCAKGTQWQLASKALSLLPMLLLEQQDYTFNAVVSACAKAELEAASSNSIALSLQQMNDIRQTLVTTLVKNSFQRLLRGEILGGRPALLEGRDVARVLHVSRSLRVPRLLLRAGGNPRKSLSGALQSTDLWQLEPSPEAEETPPEVLTVLDSTEVEGKTALAVKQALVPKVGVSRFRQKLLDGANEIPDDQVFTSTPERVQLVKLEFCPPDAEEDKQMLSAARNNNLVALEDLLRRPRDPNVTGEDCCTPLHHAVQSGHGEPVRLLLEAGAEVDRHGDGDFEVTPLWWAAYCRNTEAALLLLEAGANPDMPAIEDGETPLYVASQQCHFDMVELLVDCGVNIDKPETEGGRTPLFQAVFRDSLCAADPRADILREQYLHIVRLLVESGADKDKAAHNGETPLHVAAKNGNSNMVQLLVQSGANSRLRKTGGATALDLATLHGHVDVVQFLSEAPRAQPFSADAVLRMASEGQSKRAGRWLETLLTRNLLELESMVNCFGALAVSYAREGNAGAAMRYLQRIRDVGGTPEAEIFRSLLEAFAEGEEPDPVKTESSLVLLQQMRRAGHAPDLDCCKAVLRSLGLRNQDPAAAARWMKNEMPQLGVEPDVESIEILVEAYFLQGLRKGVSGRAETYLHEGYNAGPGVDPLRSEQLGFGEALALQSQPSQAASSSSSAFLDDTSAVRGGLDREKTNKRATKVFEKFQNKYPELSKRVASGLGGGKGEQQRLSTFHQGGPSSSGESQEDCPENKEKEEVKSEVDYDQ
eukprot:s723_g1.t1